MQENNIEYVIPLSSAKDKHRTWKNVDADSTFKHILSVMDLKKMIPIKAGLYSEVDLNLAEDDSAAEKKYKVLLNIEYSFCLKIIDSVIKKASRLYEKQIRTKKVIRFCCDFRLLEEKCREYAV